MPAYQNRSQYKKRLSNHEQHYHLTMNANKNAIFPDLLMEHNVHPGKPLLPTPIATLVY